MDFCNKIGAKRTPTFVLDCLLGVNETELQFGVGTRIALQTKTNWRTRHDSNV